MCPREILWRLAQGILRRWSREILFYEDETKGFCEDGFERFCKDMVERFSDDLCEGFYEDEVYQTGPDSFFDGESEVYYEDFMKMC